jgi:hypothetical protein
MPIPNYCAKYKKYFTGYIAWDWSLYPKAPYRGKGFLLDFEKMKDGKDRSSTIYHDKPMENRQIIIYSNSFNRARNAMDLINCGLWLSSGESAIENPIPFPGDTSEFWGKRPLQEYFDDLLLTGPSEIHTSHYPRPCLIAARASYYNSYRYALAKFWFASKLHSIDRVDIDPSLATEHLGVSRQFAAHVNFAYSIIAAYSAIEEIGLEIRASKENPATINGQWNPSVRADLENRLKKAGINIKDNINWDLRGKPTRVEKAKRLQSLGRCPWARGPYVRDCELQVVDAINQASFLRSKISSHRFGKLVSSLTSYDVENVRHLARKLILSSLGLWETFKKLNRDFVAKAQWKNQP